MSDSNELRRFVDGGPEQLRTLFARLPPPSSPPADLHLRIAARIDERQRRRWARYAFPFAALALAGAAAAYVAPRAHRSPSLTPAIVTLLTTSPEPVIAPSPPIAPAVAQPPRPRHTTHAVPPPRPVSEAEFLGGALRALRQNGDAQQALTLLAKYFARFPEGDLQGEARLAEIEALLRLDRTDEALARLGAGIGALPRAAELFAIRGELLSKRSDCDGAAKAFAEAERRAPEDIDVLERVRRGRIACPPGDLNNKPSR